MTSPPRGHPGACSQGLPHPVNCDGGGGGGLEVFLAGVGGGVRAGGVRQGRSYPDWTVSPAHPSPSHARGLWGVESSGRFEKARGGRGRD